MIANVGHIWSFCLKLYLLLTDGKTLPTIRQHMAKIYPFLESKTDIFSCYLPVSDINLAEKKHLAQRQVATVVRTFHLYP